MSLPNLRCSSDEESSSHSGYGDEPLGPIVEDEAVQTEKPKISLIQRALIASQRVDKLLRKLKKEDDDEAELEKQISSRINLLKTIRTRIRREAENQVEIEEEDYANWLKHQDFTKRLTDAITPKPFPLKEIPAFSVEGTLDKAVQATSAERLEISLSNFVPEDSFTFDESEYREWLQKNDHEKYLLPASTVKKPKRLKKSKSLTELPLDEADDYLKAKAPVASPSHLKFVKELDSVIYDAEYQLLQSRQSRLLHETPKPAPIVPKKASRLQILKQWFWAIALNDYFWSFIILSAAFIYYYVLN